ncbi:protein-L-isoaspartate O-methyltransferase [Halovibrio variabilis]|uniref:Protein-L-isoaspartate O-methyltransferase n=1 Tax=Halovibrio variabilis TaxID=31910 RepID=A0A511UMI0_9GAMM|nr:protein-L-isoaspartate(D-aspartate) O-methyltransferase [Halovibrio variabilis]GEN27797.1 protein-L-isoaspartate O-methyltransferase [Halovibrio variabilis]
MAKERDQHSYTRRRQAMVTRHIAQRGITSSVVLNAMGKVPREAFLPPSLREFAYEDSALPINEQQTISQPYIVAYMVDALQLTGGGKLLEVGTGSGYAAAILGEIGDDVVTIERYETLADSAREVLGSLGYDNIEVVHGDGTLGWPAQAPYDGIVVAAGGPEVPESLKQQLAIGGRLVIPISASQTEQALIRVTRVSEHEFREEHLTEVRFVPLVGDAGWEDRHADKRAPVAREVTQRPSREASSMRTSELIAEAADPIDDIDEGNIDRLLERIGDSRVVLIGEASHGTSEFYRFRARITRALIEKKGFDFVAVEADWPDASRIDHYVRHLQTPPAEWTAFARFPTWMWRNEEVRGFVDWLREHNASIHDPEKRVAFYGLDLYSLFTSISAVLDYLDEVDPQAAATARERYGCLTPWQSDPATYGRAAAAGRYRECEDDVVATLVALINKRMEYAQQDGERFMDAVHNARLIANAERYYRSMYSGYSDSWNLRDQHMFDTLDSLLSHGGHGTKAVIWEHNSHIGDASATDMSARGQHNVGQLCREAYGDDAYLIGFGTHSGTVAAASNWDEPMEVKQVRPSLRDSWERLFHDAGMPACTLPLRHPASRELDKRMHESYLERAIGVIYRPETERASHYFKACLAEQFDEYVWIDQTRAVTPLASKTLDGVPDAYPFGL